MTRMVVRCEDCRRLIRSRGSLPKIMSAREIGDLLGRDRTKIGYLLTEAKAEYINATGTARARRDYSLDSIRRAIPALYDAILYAWADEDEGVGDGG